MSSPAHKTCPKTVTILFKTKMAIPTPRKTANAYLLYNKEMRKNYKEELEKGYISRCISQSWRAMSDEQKMPFKLQAMELSRLSKLDLAFQRHFASQKDSQDCTLPPITPTTPKLKVSIQPLSNVSKNADSQPLTPRSSFLFQETWSTQCVTPPPSPAPSSSSSSLTANPSARKDCQMWTSSPTSHRTECTFALMHILNHNP